MNAPQHPSAAPRVDLPDPRSFRRALRRVAIGPLLPALFTVLVLLGGVQWVRQSSGWVERDNAILTQAHKVDMILVELSSNQSSFESTHERRRLGRYRRVRARLEPDLNRMVQLTISDPDHHRQAIAVRKTILAYVTETDRLMSAPPALNSGAVSPDNSDALRHAAFNEMEEFMSEARLTRNGQLYRLRNAHKLLFSGLLIGFLVLGPGVGLLMRRSMSDSFSAFFRNYEGAQLADAALRNEEERFRTLAEEMPHFVWEIDARGTPSYLNRRFLQYAGITAERFVPDLFWQLQHPEDAEGTQKLWRQAVESGSEYEVETRFRQASTGEYRWFRVRGAPVRAAGGGITRWVGTCTDVHAAKLANDVVRRSEALLLAVINNCPDLIYLKDLDGKLVLANTAMAGALGLPPEFVIGSAMEWFSADPGISPEAAQDQMVLQRGEAQTFEESILTPGGRHTYLTLKAPWRDPIGKVLGIISISRDITERTRSEEALRASETRYRALFKSMQEGFFLAEPMFDTNGKLCDIVYLDVNPALERLLGYDSREMVGRRARDISRPLDADWMEILGEVATTGLPKRCPNLRHGADKVFEMVAFRPAEGQVAALVTDITHRRQAEEALIESKERAEMASRAKDDFLAVLSHELRTPLTPVLMLAEWRASDPAVSPELRNDFAMIRRNVAHEAELIDDLLDTTRVTRGKLKMTFVETDLHEVILSSTELLQSKAAEKRIDISCAMESPEHLVSGDVVRLRQVFCNLLGNAVKFTPEDGAIRLCTSMGAPGYVHFVITDTGLGMTSEEIKRAFDPFAQGEHAANSREHFGGLGLGLSIAQRIVELHNGRIWAESAGRGQGTAFHVELPVLQSAAGAA